MNKHKTLLNWPILAILVATMLAVGLACGGEKATPTSPPKATATLAPTATQVPPTATVAPTATLMPGETPLPTATATAVPTATATAMPTPTVDIAALPWIERLTQSEGYKPEWGEPKTGGIVKLGMPKNPPHFNMNVGSTTPGPHAMVPFNSLFRFNPWVGQTSIIGDLARSWEMSGDGLHLTVKLEEGVTFQDNPKVPADYNGGKITGDLFTCEDVQASVERHVRPPKWEVKITKGRSMLNNLNGVSCPDGALGYTAVLNFDLPKANTLASLSSGHMTMLDKEYIDWINAEKPAVFDTSSPETFLLLTGYGAFVPKEYVPDVITKHRRNPNHFREGLPLVDGLDLHILKDHTTRFTALATGQIHYFGHGSYSMLMGQVAQVERDFMDRVVINTAQHNWALGITINLSRAPFDDRRVRQAFYLALDRDDYLMFKKAGSYPGAKLVGGYLPPGTSWINTEEELRTWPGLRQPKDQDIAEANRLMDEVFGKGKRPSFVCDSDIVQTNIDTCLFFIDQMKKSLNMNVSMETMETAVRTQKTESGQFDVSGGSPLMTTVGDPDDIAFQYFHRDYATTPSSVIQVKAAWEIEPVLQAELEDMIVAQSRELDPVKRKEMVQVLDRKLGTEMIYRIGFGWNVIFVGTTPSLKGFVLTPYGIDSGWSHWERVWLAN